MKRKLTSAVLAIVLTVSLSIPAFAADEWQGGCSGDWNVLVWQMLCGCGGCGGQNGAPDDWNALLRAWLNGQPTQNAPQPSKPAQSEKPTQADTHEQPEKPTQNDKPSAQKPPQPETPVQNGKPAESGKPAQTETQQSAQASTLSAYEREVVRLVNVEREKEGLSPLSEDALLARTARMKSQDMHDNGYFDHQSPTYGSPFDLMKSQGIRYRTAGENIAMGYRTPEAVVAAWMASPGHRANILNASYTKIGVGYVASGNYWTQHFTS